MVYVLVYPPSNYTGVNSKAGERIPRLYSFAITFWQRNLGTETWRPGDMETWGQTGRSFRRVAPVSCRKLSSRGCHRSLVRRGGGTGDAGEIEGAIMAAPGGWPDTWLVEPVPPGDSGNGHGQHTRFSTMERSSEKNADLRSQLNRESVSGGVKGQDERQKKAPLTPPLTLTAFYALTTANVVIDRMTRRYRLDADLPTR